MIRKKMDGYAIITGSARGIGRAIVLDLADEGYDVVINHVSGSSAARAAAVSEECRAKGVKAIVVQADVSTYEGCKKLVAESVKEFGEKICILGNNAGIASGQDIIDQDEKDLRRVVDADLMSALFMVREVLPYMSRLGYGCIISLSSIGPLCGVENQVTYDASKFGLVGMSRGMCREFAKWNIRVNTIAPGVIETDMLAAADPAEAAKTINAIPLKRLGQPEDIAQTFTWMCSCDFLSGQNVTVNGGAVFL